MLRELLWSAFLQSLENIGQSIPILAFWVLSVVLATVLVWKHGGLMKDYGKKLLETIGISLFAWLPFFFWSLGYQWKAAEVPYVVRASVPPAPQLAVARTVPEPRNSLRRRIMRLCDELDAFNRERGNLRALVPDVRDANGKATELAKFDAETVSLYVSRGLKERTVQVLREIRSKGLNIGYLEMWAEQWPQSTAAMPGQSYDTFLPLREYAYHFDAHDNVVRID